MLTDGAAMVVCLYIAITLRYGMVDFPYRADISWLWIALPIVGVTIYRILGLYDILIRAMESRTMTTLLVVR